MSGFAAQRFGSGLAVSAGIELVLFLATWVIARRVGRWNVVDTTWGLSFAAVAAGSFAWSAGIPDAGVTMRALVLSLTAAWGLRLAAYISIRSHAGGEDPRYAAILDRAAGNRSIYALRVVILPQAFLSWLVSLPVQMAMYERARPGPLTGVGVALWAVGMLFESVGDAQMALFRRQPANRGGVLDRGLWRYTRHPNYFGDASVWCGLFLVAAGRWPGATTVVSPLVMLYFLYFKSGKGLLEKRMAESRPAYRAYMERTSGFLPRPPRG